MSVEQSIRKYGIFDNYRLPSVLQIGSANIPHFSYGECFRTIRDGIQKVLDLFVGLAKDSEPRNKKFIEDQIKKRFVE